MRRLAAITLTAFLLVLNPGLVFTAGATPGAPPDVETASTTLTEAQSKLVLPVATAGKVVQYGKLDVKHRSGVAGVTWTGATPTAVFLRATNKGVVGAWTSVDVDPADPTEPGNGKGGTDPFVIAGSDAMEAVTVSATAVPVTLSLYTSPQTSTRAIGVATARAATESYAWSNPQIVSRASWGADESLVRYAYTYAQVTGVMIHHTAGSNTYTEADVPGILRAIQVYHVTGRGWNDIAYNILVDKFGKAWEGRGGGVNKAVQGGHAYGLTNARVFGLSMIGNYQTATPSSAMLDTAERVIAWKFALHGVDPNGTTYGSGGQDGGSAFLNAISGHRDENATDCPGQYVYSQFGAIRQKVTSYLPMYQGTATAPVANAGPDQSTAVNAKVTLDASASTTGSTFVWKQTAGTAVTLDGATSAQATFTPTAAGTYTFQVTATRSGLTATDSVTVTVKAAANNAPTASAGSAQSVTTGTVVTLNGSGSDPDAGTTLTYAWARTGGTGPTVTLSDAAAAKPTFKPTVAGTYVFELTVSDGASTAKASVTITATTPAPAPAPAPVATNLARAAGVTVTASSQNTSTGQTAAKAVDGVAQGYPADYTREWATVGGKAGSTITLTWASPVTVDKVVLYDRPNTSDAILAGTLTFSDGSQVPVPALNNAGAATTITFPARTVTSVRLSVTSASASTENVGLAEMEVWGSSGTAPVPPPVPTPPPTPAPTSTNQALAAGVTVTASSQNTSTTQTAAKAVDGSTAGYPVDYTREWATVGGTAGSWLQLTWAAPVTLDKVVLYDRPNTSDRITGGTLVFSNGTSVPVGSLDNAGGATTVTFAARTVTSVRLDITSVAASTANVGLAEFQAWGTAG